MKGGARTLRDISILKVEGFDFTDPAIFLWKRLLSMLLEDGGRLATIERGCNDTRSSLEEIDELFMNDDVLLDRAGVTLKWSDFSV